MSWFDLVIIAIVAVSALVGAFRGLVKESVSLATWVLAVWISVRFAPAFANVLPDSLSKLMFSLGELEFRVDNLNVGIAMIVLFVLTLIVGGVVNFLFSYLVKVANFTMTDRVLGGLFGVARGGLLVVAIVLLAGLTTLPSYPFWEKSLLVPPFEQTVSWVLGILPDRIAAYFSYAR